MSRYRDYGIGCDGPEHGQGIDAGTSLTVTLGAAVPHGKGRGYDYEVTDATGTVVAEGWTTAATKAEAEKQATDHAYRNIAARARKGARKESR